MGKFGPSAIHDWWSNWHYHNQEIKRTAWLTDVDDTKTLFGSIRRTWVEQRPDKGIVAVLELKWAKSKQETLTKSEGSLLNFYEKNSIPFYIIGIDNIDENGNILSNPIQFHIYRPLLDQNNSYCQSLVSLSEKQMVEWINSDYDFDYLKKFRAN